MGVESTTMVLRNRDVHAVHVVDASRHACSFHIWQAGKRSAYVSTNLSLIGSISEQRSTVLKFVLAS